MNRSILIVICDFIITSMIYLNGGFSALESQPHDGRPADRTTVDMIASELEAKNAELEEARAKLLKAGETPANQQELDRIARELAETRARLEQIRRRNELTSENSGKMTPEDMRSELKDEIYKKNLAQARYETLLEQLQSSRAGSQELQRENIQVQQQIARLDERIAGQKKQYELQLDEKNRQIRQHEEQIADQDRQLDETGKKLDAARDELAKKSSELTGAQKDIKHIQRNLQQTQQRLLKSERDREQQFKRARSRQDALRRALQESEQKRENAEKQTAARQAELDNERARQQRIDRELAKAQDELRKSREALKQAKAQIEADRRNIDTMKRVVADTSRKLSDANAEKVQARAELKQIQKRNQALEADSAKLKAVQKDLDFYRSDLAQLNYSKAVAALDLKWRQDRLIGDRLIRVQSYLPTFAIGNRHFVISTLSVIGGKQENSSRPTNIVQLDYLAGKPGNANSVRVTGPIWLAADDCRVAMMEVTGVKDVKPLKLMTWKDLNTRGSLDLYLFKAKDMKRNAKLENRCSWGAGSDRYIYVVNSTSRTANELKAAEGDLLLTRQGELAAVVVSVKNNRARCYVFAADPNTSQMPRIDLGSPRSKFQEFTTGVNLFLEKGDKLTREQR